MKLRKIGESWVAAAGIAALTGVGGVEACAGTQHTEEVIQHGGENVGLKAESGRIQRNIKEYTAKIKLVREMIFAKSGEVQVALSPEEETGLPKVELPANIGEYSLEMLKDFMAELEEQRRRLIDMESEKAGILTGDVGGKKTKFTYKTDLGLDTDL